MSFEKIIHRFYIKWLRPVFSKSIHQQRLKMIWFCWSYWPILFIKSLPVLVRFGFLIKFLRIDWSIEHSHTPSEIIEIIQFIAERPASKDEIVLEAGCWQGGSTVKFSIFCNYFGYKLHVYDSFEGVESIQEGGYDFSGEYCASEKEVKRNLIQYGVGDVCVFHKGWFSETLKPNSVNFPIRAVYIDCDLAKGTEEVLRGVLPWLVKDGTIFTQDYHILSVKQLLNDPATWGKLGVVQPMIKPLCHNLAVIKFHE
jgi:O-methyltransferase